MINFQTELETEVKQPLDLLTVEFEETVATHSAINDKMATLEAKLALARQKLLALEQPVNYGIEDFSVMENPDAGKTDLLFSEIQLDFSYGIRAQGVLFFVENHPTHEKMLLQIVDEFLVYEYNNGEVTTRAESPAVLCAGCWFRVTATRSVLSSMSQHCEHVSQSALTLIFFFHAGIDGTVILPHCSASS